MIHIFSFFTVELGNRYIPMYTIMNLILIYVGIVGTKHEINCREDKIW